MGVDLASYRARIGCYRGNHGTDVTMVTVTIKVTMAAKRTCVMAFLIVCVLSALSCIISFDQETEPTVIENAKLTIGILYANWFLCYRKSPRIECLVRAVTFIQLLLLASGIESNPGPHCNNIQQWELPILYEAILSVSHVWFSLVMQFGVTVFLMTCNIFFSVMNCHASKEHTRAHQYTKDTLDMCVCIHDNDCKTVKSSNTCSYLLGNKGVHMTNGNPHNKEAIVADNDTIDWIERGVQESIGYISIDRRNGDDILPNDDFFDHGTGFRVGDRYLMTAYHVFRKKINQLLDSIIFCAPECTPDMLKKLDIDNHPSEMTKEIAIRKFIANNGLDIPMLMSCLDSKVAETVSEFKTVEWRDNCVIDFKNHGRFTADWKIPFGLAERDVVILQLLKTEETQRMPKPLFLEEQCEDLSNCHLVRYITEGNPRIELDILCKVYEDNEELTRDVEAAINWWTDICPDKVGALRESYSECSKAQNKDTGLVILRAAASLIEGSSGSPLIYLKSGQPFAGMVYQGGCPRLFYLEKEEFEKKIQEKTQNEIDIKVLFQRSTSIEHVAKSLTTFHKQDLKENLFHTKAFERHILKDKTRDDIRHNYDDLFTQATFHTEKIVQNTGESIRRIEKVIEAEDINELKSIVMRCKTKTTTNTDDIQNILFLAAAKGSKNICDFLMDQRLPSTSGYINSELSAVLFGDKESRLYSPLSIAVHFNKKENVKSLLPWAQESDITMVEQHQQEIETLILREIQKRLERKFKGRTLGVEAGFRNGKSVLVVYTDSLKINPFKFKDSSFCGRSFYWRNPKIIREPNPKCFEHAVDLSLNHIEVGKQIINDNAPYLWSHHSNLNIISIGASPQESGLAECSIWLFCTSKGIIPADQNEFPKTLSTNDNKLTLPVHVEEGFFELCPTYETSPSKEFHQHLKMGCSISPGNESRSGSLGPFIDINGQDGFLTCAHVLLDVSSGHPSTTGLEVYQPEFGSLSTTHPRLYSSYQPCGTVVKTVFNPKHEYSVDVAAVRITDDLRKPEKGHFAVDSMENYKNLGFDDPPDFNSGQHIDPINMPTNRKVIKCGKTTHLTQGFVKCWGTQVRQIIGTGTVNQQIYEMKNQMEVLGIQPSVFFQPGDSGSAVFQVKDDNSLECIGMAIGSTSYYTTIVTPISAILRQLGPGYSLKRFQ